MREDLETEKGARKISQGKREKEKRAGGDGERGGEGREEKRERKNRRREEEEPPGGGGKSQLFGLSAAMGELRRICMRWHGDFTQLNLYSSLR